MDEQTSGTPQQDPNAQPIPTGATTGTPESSSAQDTTSTSTGIGTDEGTSTTATSGAIVDKTLAEIASGVVKDVEHDAKDVVDTDVAKVETKVNHEAHGILDELEQHLSQFDARAVAIYHSFLQRLRNAL